MCRGAGLPTGVPYLSYFLDGPIHTPSATAADRPQRVRLIKSDGKKLKQTNRRQIENAGSGKGRALYIQRC